MHAAAEVDLQEAVLVQREGLRCPFDLVSEVEPLVIGKLGLIDRLLQLARGRVRCVDHACYRRRSRPRDAPGLRHELLYLGHPGWGKRGDSLRRERLLLALFQGFRGHCRKRKRRRALWPHLGLHFPHDLLGAGEAEMLEGQAVLPPLAIKQTEVQV